MPKHYFRIKEHGGKGYLYKVRCEREPGVKHPRQKTLFVGEVHKILKVIQQWSA